MNKSRTPESSTFNLNTSHSKRKFLLARRWGSICEKTTNPGVDTTASYENRARNYSSVENLHISEKI